MKLEGSIRWWTAVVVSVILVIAPARLVNGQDTTQTETQYQDLIKEVKRGYFNLGVLLQAVLDYQDDRTLPLNNGFRVENFRLQIAGELDNRFGYFLQTNFTIAPIILDAEMYLRVTPKLRFDVGLFKTPFSREFLIPASSIDFVNRSRAVALMVPGRQVGLGTTWGRSNGPLTVSAGVFNGNGIQPLDNDGNNMMVVARVAGTSGLGAPPSRQLSVTYGADVAYSKDTDALLLGGRFLNFEGQRTLASADAGVALGRFVFSTEWVLGDYQPAGQSAVRPWGGNFTGGYRISPRVQVLARTDILNLDDSFGTSNWIILGLNVWPTDVTEVQVNYILDADDGGPENNQLLVNFQIGF